MIYCRVISCLATYNVTIILSIRLSVPTGLGLFVVCTAASRFMWAVSREVKYDVNGRQQTAKTTSTFEFFSSTP